jgi:hypothetical protein
MQNEIAVLSMRFATVCFILYVILVLAPLLAKKSEKTTPRRKQPGEGFAAGTISEVSGLMSAVATLTEALAKAGPALWSLIGSLLFLLIAGMAAGVFAPAS